MSRTVLPEKLVSLAVSNSGEFFAGGGVSGRLYTWSVSSDLLQIIDAHVSSVSCISFASDDSYIVTGGEDSLVQSYLLTDCVDPGRESSTIRPYAVFSGHKNKITSMRVSSVPGSVRLYTSSLDSMCKIWNLHTGEILASIEYSSPILALAVDSTETVMFSGGSSGEIFVTYFSESNQSQSECKKLLLHKEEITSLEVSLDNKRLVSSSLDLKCVFWDITTGEKVLVADGIGDKVHKIFSIIKPRDLCASRPKFEPLEWVPLKFKREISNKSIRVQPKCHEEDIIPKVYAISKNIKPYQNLSQEYTSALKSFMEEVELKNN